MCRKLSAERFSLSFSLMSLFLTHRKITGALSPCLQSEVVQSRQRFPTSAICDGWVCSRLLLIVLVVYTLKKTPHKYTSTALCAKVTQTLLRWRLSFVTFQRIMMLYLCNYVSATTALLPEWWGNLLTRLICLGRVHQAFPMCFSRRDASTKLCVCMEYAQP